MDRADRTVALILNSPDIVSTEWQYYQIAGLVSADSQSMIFGVLNYGSWHTAISDSREVYWDDKKPGYDGKAGTYVETLGGKRFQNGTWPEGAPPIYPGQ